MSTDQKQKDQALIELEAEYQVFYQQVVKILENYQQTVEEILAEIKNRKLAEVRKKIRKI